MTHTPKPWIKGKAGGCVIAPNADSRVMDDAERKFYGGYLIAESINKVDDINLVIAAPDLLEACEAISEALAKGELAWKHKRQLDNEPYHQANVKLCAAIAKAKGNHGQDG
jgi:hypothetical protein